MQDAEASCPQVAASGTVLSVPLGHTREGRKDTSILPHDTVEQEQVVREARAIYTAVEEPMEAQRLREAFAGISYGTAPLFAPFVKQTC